MVFEGNLSLTIFRGPIMVKLKLGRPNMVRLKFPSKNRPNMVKLSSISILFFALLLGGPVSNSLLWYNAHFFFWKLVKWCWLTYLVMWLKSRMPLRQMNSKVPCDFHSQWSLHSKRRAWSQNHPGWGWVCSFSEIPSTSSCWKFWCRKEWENGHSICLPVYHSSCSRPFWPNQEASLSSLSEENHNWNPITSRIDVTLSLIYSKSVSDFQK